jgi:hypothetical protein
MIDREHDPARWLLRELTRLYRRSHHLPDAAEPEPVAAPAEPPPPGTDALSPSIVAILDFLAQAGVELQPNESLAQATARACFDETGALNENGHRFFAGTLFGPDAAEPEARTAAEPEPVDG